MHGALRKAWLVGFLVCAVVACTKKSQVTPSQTVERFFDAVAAGDCVAALNLLDGTAKTRLAPVPCEELTELFSRKRLDKILGVETDGRDPTATVVKVLFSGEAEPALIRVQKSRGTNRITSL